MMTTTLEELGQRLVALRAQPIPDQGKLAQHVVDAVGAWVAGARTEEGRKLLRFRARQRPQRGGVDRADNVATACALARLSEIDDIHLASMITAGGIVIPAALTIAAAIPAPDAQRLGAAILSGYAAMIRLGAAIDGPSVLYRGIWPTYFAAPFGGAAVAAALLDLDAPQTAHALALALTVAAPGVGHHNAATTSRWLAVGQAAARGLVAAEAAAAGFTADLKLLDGAFLPDIYQITPRQEALRAPLQDVLAQVSFKPWCAARQTMAATQAWREILREGIAVQEIRAVTAFVLPPHLKMIAHNVTPGDRASFLTSLPYQMARAALVPETALDVAASPTSAAADALMAKITVVPDEALLGPYPAAWPARVVVETASGRRECAVTAVPGDPDHALDVQDKFTRVVAPLIGPRQSAWLESAAAHVIENPQSLQALLGAVEAAFAS